MATGMHKKWRQVCIRSGDRYAYEVETGMHKKWRQVHTHISLVGEPIDHGN